MSSSGFSVGICITQTAVGVVNGLAQVWVHDIGWTGAVNLPIVNSPLLHSNSVGYAFAVATARCWIRVSNASVRLSSYKWWVKRGVIQWTEFCEVPAHYEFPTWGSWARRLKDPRRNTYKNFEASIHRERGTRYEFPTWGSWARRLKDPRRNTYKNFEEGIHRERGTRYEFPTWGSWARRLKDPQEKHIQLNTQPKAEHPAAAVSLPRHKKSVGRMRLPHKRPQSAAVEHQTPTYPRSFQFGANILSFHSPYFFGKTGDNLAATKFARTSIPHLFVSNAVEYARSNTNAISSSAELTMPPRARAVTEELIVAQSHQKLQNWQVLTASGNRPELMWRIPERP